MYDLACIGASWGGLKAVGHVLTDLPAEFDLPIAIVQHRHPDSQEGALAELRPPDQSSGRRGRAACG